MPCNCEHMEPRPEEILAVEIAKNLLHLHERGGFVFEDIDKIRKAANSNYGMPAYNDRWTALACSTIRGMSDETREAIVYDAHDKQSRALADWWERHQEADRIREEKERAKWDGV